ncbi:hypothetical protein ABFS83_02G052900 [Erythranthe nasuta]
MKNSVLFPPIKTPIPTTSTTDNAAHASTSAAVGGGASVRRPKPPQPPLFVPPGHVVFRLLCHISRIGGVIGKSGSIIKQLQQLTNSRIRVEDPTESGDHRVISVVSSPAVVNKIKISDDEDESNGGSAIGGGAAVDEEWFEVSAAQEGILRVFDRVVEVAAEGDSVERIGGGVLCQLLVWQNQAGAVIGKGGKVVEKIRKDTGCRIKVVALEKFPSGSIPTEEIVEIEGNLSSVKRALVLITSRLQDFQPPEKTTTTTYGSSRHLEEESPPMPAVDRRSMQPPMPSVDQPSSLDSERVSNVNPTRPQREVSFKIFCPNEQVGSIIGKGGSVIKALQFRTGASIIIGPAVAECDERYITISSMESVESEYSPAQHATVLVFKRSVEAAGSLNGFDSHSKGSNVTARILVQSNQVGCLLGKGGAIISEMRKLTGAGLKIIGGNQVPKCALENVEVLQITGEFGQVQDALYKMTGKLRDNMFWNCNNSWTSENNSSYGRTIRDPPPPLGSRFGASEKNLNNQNSLTQSMDRLRISNNINPPPSPSLSTVSGVNQGSMDVSRRLHAVTQLGSGSRSPIVTNTTVEILVPDTVIGSVYGENGSNLARLRQISGAKVVIHDPHPGTTQRIVVISGTPDETQVAQSLLQAFVLSGS